MALLRHGFLPAGSGEGSPLAWRASLLTLLLAGVLPVAGQSEPSREYDIKAVFLHHFTRFVEWPAAAAPAAAAPFVVGVLGEDPFGAGLDDVMRGERVGRRPIEVRRVRSLDAAVQCDLLFVSRSEADRLPEIFDRLRGQPVLTVGDADRFARQGGMIGLVTRNNRVRFRINLAASRAAGFSINSNLLRAATIVETAD